MAGRLRRTLRSFLSVTFVLCGLAEQPARAQIPEGQLKGLVIERFTRFIDWPPDAFAPDPSFVICLLGVGEVLDDVARVARTQRFKDRPARVRRLAEGTDPSGCHVLFIAASEERRLPAILAEINDRPILSVSDTPGFAHRGVLINLYLENEYVRFEINLSGVAQSKLKFSSKLLRLARLVNPPPPR